MANQLEGVRVAILATDGFEQVEMTEPRKALDAAGAKTVLIGPQGKKEIRGFNHHDPGDTFKTDATLDAVRPEEFDALLLPGGVANPDELRTIPEAVEFARAFVDSHRPVGAICHGPWLLVEADVVKGRTVTSWPSLKTDLTNAGAKWVDREVVSDDGITTSRKPDDIPAFSAKLLEEFKNVPASAGASSKGRI